MKADLAALRRVRARLLDPELDAATRTEAKRAWSTLLIVFSVTDEEVTDQHTAADPRQLSWLG